MECVYILHQRSFYRAGTRAYGVLNRKAQPVVGSRLSTLQHWSLKRKASIPEDPDRPVCSPKHSSGAPSGHIPITCSRRNSLEFHRTIECAATLSLLLHALGYQGLFKEESCPSPHSGPIES